MSIVTVVQKSQIKGADNIECLLLNNKKRTIVLKNTFEVGSKGLYIRTGSVIDLSKIDNPESIKFIHQKNSSKEFLVKGLKYKGEHYDGILLRIQSDGVEELKKCIIKKPTEQKVVEKKRLPQKIRDIQHVNYTDHPNVSNFMDENLYILKYMKDALSVTFDLTEKKVYSKKSEVTDKNSIYFKIYDEITLKENFNCPELIYGKIYKGELYVINMLKDNRILSLNSMNEFCNYFGLKSAIIGVCTEKFYKNDDLVKLLYVNKQLNDYKTFPNEFVIVRNNQGLLLKIKNNYFTNLFLNYKKTKFNRLF